VEKLKNLPPVAIPRFLDEMKKRLPSEAEKVKNTPTQTPQKDR
jgi:hypothetical protein